MTEHDSNNIKYKVYSVSIVIMTEYTAGENEFAGMTLTFCKCKLVLALLYKLH